ncbi:SDR family NAD(P)-dependent oxidoreductase [Streptomyces sp. NBC_01506]|uniref:SDR family NAD(P)-dependent oxidoreductase n=1 Tax=Streptomyces sp. NBC_01506 TaxID=2903887 RepID=UPI00386DA27D
MRDEQILVVGGTGTTGSRVVALLRERGVAVRVASRTGEPRFDWIDRGTWDGALDGVTGVYVVPFDGESLTRPFVERAVARDVGRIVLLSGRGVDVPGYAGEASVAGPTHVDGEDAVRGLGTGTGTGTGSGAGGGGGAGTRWTIVRPAWFAQNFSEGFFLDAVLTGELRLPAGDGAASFVDADDIAAVAVAALTEDGHGGRTYELSGPRALTIAEALAEISGAAGREIRYVPLSPEEFVAELREQGLSAAEAADYAESLSPLRRGLDSHVSDGVRRALGREPRDFHAFVKSAAADGAWRTRRSTN